jgi:hypothetical protein
MTPGRQRSYLYHFAAAKQSATRVARIEKAMPAIFEGSGFPATNASELAMNALHGAHPSAQVCA